MIKISRKRFVRHENEYIETDNYVLLRIISDTHGTMDFILDKEDLDKVKQYHWCINKCMNKTTTKFPRYYAGVIVKAKDNKSKSLLLHRLLMGEPKGMVVDHRNGDSLDNRKSNLRVCTIAENRINNGMSVHNKSGVTGVFWDKNHDKWIAFLMIHRKYKHLGYYNNIEDAIQARREGENKYFGEFARSNSITEDNQLINEEPIKQR